MVSAVVFERFRTMSVPSWLGKAAAFVAPSMFSVYLLHITGGGLKLMSQFETWMYEKVGVSLWLVFALTAIVTFILCIILDFVRRGLVFAFKVMFDGLCADGK